MNAKHRIISVFLILAMVTTLCVVMAAPASAAALAGGFAATPATVTPGSVSAYTIVVPMVTTAATTQVVTFPAGTTVPATIATANVTCSGSTTGALAVATVVVAGQVVTVTHAAAVVETVTTTFAAGAGIRNPATAESYTLNVSTNVDTVATSAAYLIGSGVALSPSTAGQTAQVTIDVRRTVAIAAGDVISITFPAGTTIPTTIPYTAVRFGSGATVAAATAALAPILSTDAAPMVSGQTVMIPIKTLNAAAGFTRIVISQLAGIVNPSVGSSAYTVSVTSTATGEVAGTSGAYTVTRLVSFSPTYGPAGTPITVTGVGFAPSRSIDVVDASTLTIGSGTTGADGSFTLTAGIMLGGTITATDGAGNATAAATNFTVTAKAVLTPASGLVRTSFVVSASGLTAATTYGISIADLPVSIVSLDPTDTTSTLNTGGLVVTGATGTPFNSITTGAAATTAKFIVRIPAGSTAGPKTVAIRPVTSPYGTLAAFQAVTAVASGVFTVDARSASIAPAAGQPGTTVIVTGAGFEASVAGTTVTVNATFRDAATVPVTTTNLFGSGGAAVSGTGTFTASFAIPSGAAAGTGTLTVTSYIGGAAQSTATAYFSVAAATLAVSPASGGPGTVLTLTGTGYTPYGTLTGVTVDGVANTVVLVPSVIVGADGSFTASVTWPQLAAGVHTVVMGGTTAVGYFTQSAVSIAVTTGLNSIAGKYAKMWAFDGATQEWALYDTAEGSTSTLSTMERGQGYWIQATEACTIVYSGNTYSLSEGWNLIGWLG